MGESLPQGRAHQLATTYQMTSSTNLHASNIIETEKPMFRNIYEYTYMQVITISKKEGMVLKKSKKRYMGGFGEREKGMKK